MINASDPLANEKTRSGLAIDLGPHEGTIALFDETTGAVTAEYSLGEDFRHNERIIPTIDLLLKQNRHTLADLSCIVTNRGPGSFTGLRVAFATAKALVTSLGIPLYSINGAEARALGYGAAATQEIHVITYLTPTKFLVHCYCPLRRSLKTETLVDRETLDRLLPQSSAHILVDAATRSVAPSDSHGILVPSSARWLALAFHQAKTKQRYATATEITAASPDYYGAARFEKSGAIPP